MDYHCSTYITTLGTDLVKLFSVGWLERNVKKCMKVFLLSYYFFYPYPTCQTSEKNNFTKKLQSVVI